MRKFRTVAILFLAITLIGAGSLPVGAAAPGPEGLYLLTRSATADWELLAGAETLTRLYTAEGPERLAAILPVSQAQELARQGLLTLMLDADTRQKSYYLITALRPGALQQARRQVSLLWEDRLQGIAAAADTPEGMAQMEALTRLGIRLRRLEPRRFIPDAPEGAPMLPLQIEPVAEIEAMIEQVSPSTVSNLDGGLSGEWPVTIAGSPYTILTRYSRTSVPILQATRYAYEYFQGLGLDTLYHTYTLPGSGEKRNVIAEQTGLDQPERILLITAHLDSTSETPTTYAPGADDNASGSTGVMIAAEILSQYNFDCTLRYVLFTGEEQGLIGAQAYAADVYAAGENIEAVLNLDMIGYNSDASPILELHTRPGNSDDEAIATLFTDVVEAYNLDLEPQILADGIQASDHAAFWDYGYPGILGIEDFEDFTPEYHTTDDQLETLNLSYFTNFIKAAVGSFAHMGCLQPGYGSLSGTVTAAASGSPVSNASIIAVDNGGAEWRTRTGLNGVYWLSTPPGSYQVTISADGYAPQIDGGVAVEQNQTTILDAQLELCQAVTGLDFTHAPAAAEAGEVITFTGTVSGSLPVDFQWYFGDGGTGSGQVVTHTYAISGVYSSYVYAFNCGGAAAASHLVAVSGAPQLELPASPFAALANPGDPLIRTLPITNSGTSELVWSLGEQTDRAWLEVLTPSGTTPALESSLASLRFTAPALVGVYTATLQIASNDADQPQSELTVELTVTEACIAISGLDFSYLPEAPLAGQEVAFRASLITSSLPITYTWGFGDGSPPASGDGLDDILHRFPAAVTTQAYPVSLNAANECAAEVEVEKLVVVAPWRVFMPQVTR